MKVRDSFFLLKQGGIISTPASSLKKEEISRTFRKLKNLCRSAHFRIDLFIMSFNFLLKIRRAQFYDIHLALFKMGGAITFFSFIKSLFPLLLFSL